MRLFDTYLVIDWSARNEPSPERPTKDALWIGEATFHGDQMTHFDPRYQRTRQSCVDYVRTRLQFYAAEKKRVFVGFDFAYGYPKGFAAALGFSQKGSPWRFTLDQLSTRIRDDDQNDNNRFEVAAQLNARCNGTIPGPLWGCPQAKVELPYLTTTSPTFPFVTKAGLTLERLRLTDKHLGGVQPVWKLFYTGSVGGQALVGIPRIKHLRDDPALAAFSRVWPFETGFSAASIPTNGPFILHAEIWPGVIENQLTNDIIPDREQVKTMVRWLATLDTAGELAPLFEPPVSLSAHELQDCIDEEGWIFGCGWKSP